METTIHNLNPLEKLLYLTMAIHGIGLMALVLMV